MLIGQDQINEIEALVIVFKGGDTYTVPREATSSVRLELEYAKKEDRYLLKTGELELTKAADIPPAYDDGGSPLFSRLASGCDVTGLDVIRAGDERIFSDVPCDTLEGLGGRTAEYSNCASCLTAGGGVKLLLGAASAAPVRTDNDFERLIAGIGALRKQFGRLPTFENCRVNGLRTFMHGKRELRIEAELGVKEYGGNRQSVALIFKKVRELSLGYCRSDKTTPMNAAKLAGGRIFVVLPEFGVEFTCESIEERTYYAAGEEAAAQKRRKKKA